MDPTGLTAKAAEAAIESARKESVGFIRTVLGEAVAELGGMLGDRVRERRHKNLIPISIRANQRLKDAGVSPQQVPLKIIHPLLEAASLEEEPRLQELWANLLANAADPRSTRSVAASFPEILKTLSADEARLLDGLYSGAVESAKMVHGKTDPWDFEGYEIEEGAFRAGITPTEHLRDVGDESAEDVRQNLQRLNLALDNLQRNGLLVTITHVDEIDLGKQIDFSMYGKLSSNPQHAIKTLLNHSIKATTSRTHRFTALGQAFIVACRPPDK
jgi:hypothetical protein